MIELKKSKDEQYYFVVVAANGEPLATSEMYTTKQSAFDGAHALCKVCSYEVKTFPPEILDECDD